MEYDINSFQLLDTDLFLLAKAHCFEDATIALMPSAGLAFESLHL
jgi:hypothetical protein